MLSVYGDVSWRRLYQVADLRVLHRSKFADGRSVPFPLEDSNGCAAEICDFFRSDDSQAVAERPPSSETPFRRSSKFSEKIRKPRQIRAA